MLLSFIYSSLALSNNSLISQGDIALTFDDLDGYSYTIPKETRSGFFHSPERIDSTLKTLLKIMHIVNYAQSEDLLNIDKINKDVSEYLLINENLIKNYELTDIEFLKLKRFLFNKMAYKFMHVYIKDSVSDNDVLKLAKEKYLIQKQNYYIDKELRTFQYITLNFDQGNKDKIITLSQTVLTELKETEFKVLEEKYKDNKSIIFTSGITNFFFNEKYKKFSEFAFEPKSTGIIDKLLEVDNTLVIVNVQKIIPVGYKSFEDVKQSIILDLKKKKIKLKFGDLVSQLTQDEIIVDEEAIISLKTRYLPKIN